MWVIKNTMNKLIPRYIAVTSAGHRLKSAGVLYMELIYLVRCHLITRYLGCSLIIGSCLHIYAINGKYKPWTINYQLTSTCRLFFPPYFIFYLSIFVLFCRVMASKSQSAELQTRHKIVVHPTQKQSPS